MRNTERVFFLLMGRKRQRKRATWKRKEIEKFRKNKERKMHIWTRKRQQAEIHRRGN